MFHTVYKTTNRVNGKIYIGVHSTESLEDGYIGSGTILKRAIKKYGKEFFDHEVICFCETKEQAFWLEERLVDPIFKSRIDTYNLNVGGIKGRTGAIHSESTKELMSRKHKGKVFTADHKAKISKSLSGRTLSESHKKNVSNSKLLDPSNKGENNPFSTPKVKDLIKVTNLTKYGVDNISKIQSKKVSHCGEVKTALEWSKIFEIKCSEIAIKANNSLDGFNYV